MVEHPSLKEGFSDKLYRFTNEMVLISISNRLIGFQRARLGGKAS